MKKHISAILISTFILTVFIPIFFVFSYAEETRDELFSIKKTDITADAVHITGGYGSPKIKAVWGSTGCESDPRCALIDREGNILLDWRDTWLTFTVSDGIASLAGNKYESYRLVSGEADKPAFYTLDGRDAFDYSGIATSSPMINGRAVAFTEAYHFGTDDIPGPVIIDNKGNTVYSLPDEYGRIIGVGFDENMTGWTCLASTGYISEGLLPCSQFQVGEDGRPLDDYSADKWYYLNDLGEKVIDLSDVMPVKNNYPFYNGIARVDDLFGKSGFIDKTGKTAIPFEYDNATRCYGELIGVCKDGKWGYININNEVVIPIEYDAVYGGEGGYASVGKNGKYGIVDYKNNVVIPLEYDDISGFEDGVAYAVKDGIIYIITLNKNNPFKDVPEGKWYTEGVLYCFRRGLMSGTGDGVFSPNAKLTREMFVTILAKIDGADTSAYAGTSFSDVKTGKWYSKPIEWAFRNGYTSGSGGGKFGLGDPVTRQQLAVFLYNYTKKKEIDVSGLADISGYADAGKVARWAVTGMRWAVASGMISGTGNNNLSPEGVATRAQVATIVMKYMDRFLK